MNLESNLVLILRDGILAFFVGIGFALLFNTPKKALITAGLLGAAGHMLRFILREECGQSIIVSTLSASLLIGFASIFVAHIVHTPPIVFSMPACITMIPGLYAYRTMLGVAKLTDKDLAFSSPHLLTETAHYFILTGSLLFSLAIGLCVGTLIFRKKSIKEINLPRLGKSAG
ncbi:threonine/serine exporter family protein [Solitalea canadensis]|uniref:Threonine/Serine exporter ThrE domain-containing protein n=1 Tax=Solitalea canadensis (strain ATCC 29591 / DSM 3403 / JCM 21819 / LMG 8368 / NBRC 15130 / NCIMB 12057 / USAM 9D) TaxID=929556 RepID=H8KUD0_SOLCM|nr:threonine/serine exporter family protein [Solitalea canadensis]AFD07295.1 hypothetical protein Solca_2253 [Solitalea canadensis DSM 3403]